MSSVRVLERLLSLAQQWVHHAQNANTGALNILQLQTQIPRLPAGLARLRVARTETEIRRLQDDLSKLAQVAAATHVLRREAGDLAEEPSMVERVAGITPAYVRTMVDGCAAAFGKECARLVGLMEGLVLGRIGPRILATQWADQPGIDLGDMADRLLVVRRANAVERVRAEERLLAAR